MQIFKEDKLIQFELKSEPSIYRSRHEELVARLANGINLKRIGTKYKPITTKEVALRINKNVWFKGRDGELDLLIRTCEEKGSYSKFFWVCPLK